MLTAALISTAVALLIARAGDAFYAARRRTDPWGQA